MDFEQLPLFPLDTVLFPDGWIPLQIFEVRYLDMVQRCHREGSPFAIVALSAGREVLQRDTSGSGAHFVSEQFHRMGTLAHITELKTVQPGLLRIACRGGSRIQIGHSEKLRHGLWTAAASVVPDDLATAVPPELHIITDALERLYERLQREQAGMLPPLPPRPTAHPEGDLSSPWSQAGWVANRWAELLPLPTSTKQRLMEQDSPLLRLELVGDALEQLGIIP